MKRKPFSKDLLKIDDLDGLTQELMERLKNDVYKTLSRRGAVVGISGGIDSSVVLALSAKNKSNPVRSNMPPTNSRLPLNMESISFSNARPIKTAGSIDKRIFVAN